MGTLLAKALALTGRHLESPEGLKSPSKDGHTHTRTRPPVALAPTVLPVNVTGGDCQEMLKLELLVGVKLAQAEPLLVLLMGMETGAVA